MLGEHNNWRGSATGIAPSTGRPGSTGRFWLSVFNFVGRAFTLLAFILSYTDLVNRMPMDHAARVANLWEVGWRCEPNLTTGVGEQQFFPGFLGVLSQCMDFTVDVCAITRLMYCFGFDVAFAWLI